MYFKYLHVVILHFCNPKTFKMFFCLWMFLIFIYLFLLFFFFCSILFLFIDSKLYYITLQCPYLHISPLWCKNTGKLKKLRHKVHMYAVATLRPSSCWVEPNLAISGVQYGNQVGKLNHDLTVALKTSICWTTDMSFIKPLFTNLPSHSNIKFSLIIQRLDVLLKSVSYIILLTQCCISGVTRKEICKVW